MAGHHMKKYDFLNGTFNKTKDFFSTPRLC
jgi:hypothetical protein